MAYVFTALKWAFLGGIGFLALTFATIFLVLFLQSLGVLKKVPFSYSLRNLAVRWPITGLTAMAFTLVVALLVFMLAFVKGMYKLTESSGVAENVLVLADGSTDELFSNLGYGDIKELELRPEVVRENGKPLASWEVYVVVNQPISVRKCPKCGQLVGVDRHDELVRHGEPACEGSGLSVRGTRGRRFIQVRGIEDPAVSGRVHNLELHEGGSWFSSSAVQALPGGSPGEQAIQGVIGEGLARELGPDLGKKTLEVGDLFELGPRKWVVVGILKSAGSTFDSEVWGKFQIVGELFGKAAYTTCVLRTADAATADDLAADLSANYKKPPVTAQPEPKYYATLNTTNEQFLFGILVLALIMAFGGAIAVMNTMFAAIAQRTKDIGVLRILGFAPWQVLVSFFLESVLLALIGGLVGCAIGSLANGWSASSVISSGQGGGGKSIVLKLVVDATTLGAGMVFALVMGCLGGLIPALSAMRLKPLDAVR
jgi:ABC-type lipoprotein release transport system permease subunit